MKKLNRIKVSYLSGLIALNLGMSVNVNAVESLQAEANSDIEVIAVTGIRGSLIKSKDIKKESDTVVDAITSEDIGKFPDQNVAESLQRITGVSIDRSGGEGQSITVRGLGPEFNTTLINKRTMATTSGGRSFSFDILASELISGAEVYKTQSANLQEGAIGATINITTFKPLAIPGFKATASVKAVYDEMSGSTSPQFSGLISNTFDDEKLGVLLSFAHSQRDSRYDEANTAYYERTDLTLNDGRTFDDVYMPQNYDQIAQTESRERTGGNLVFQYAPLDTLTFTLDALYSKYEVDYRQDILAHWFEESKLTDVTLDDNRTVVKMSMGNGSHSDFMVRQSQTENLLTAFGFNADWDLNDTVSLAADISYSQASSDPLGGMTDTVAARPGDYSYDRSSGALLPTMTFNANNSSNGLTAGWGGRDGTKIDDEVLEIKFDGEWIVDSGSLATINFGVLYSDRTFGSTDYSTKWPVPVIWGDNSSPVYLDPDLFSNFDADGFLSGSDGASAQNWLTFNSEAWFDYVTSDEVMAQLDDPAASRALLAQYGTQMHASPTAYEVNETLNALYTDFHFDGDLYDMPWKVVAGIRYVETTSKSKGNQIALLDLVPAPNEDGVVRVVESEDYLPIEASNSYDNWLPSLNANIEVIEDVIARVAYSKSITRPELDEMSPLSSYSGGHQDSLKGEGANPMLMPFTSNNFDLSLEWYYQEGSYASVAAFRKDISGYLETEEVQEVVSVPSGDYDYKVTRPVNQNDAQITGYEFAIQHMFTSLPEPLDGLGVIANMTIVDSDSSSSTSGEPLPLVGLGDSQNLILFYEKDAVQFRIAYNNRSRFMQSKPLSWRGAHYVEDYAQVDISGSYDFNEKLTLFIEGINITNELTVKTAEYSNQVLKVTETGPRYSLGIRGIF